MSAELLSQYHEALAHLDDIGRERDDLREALQKAWRGNLSRTEYLSAMRRPDPLDALVEPSA